MMRKSNAPDSTSEALAPRVEKRERLADRSQHEEGLRAEAQATGRPEPPSTLARFRQLIGCFDVALADQPAKVALGQLQLEEPVDLDREVPSITPCVRRVAAGTVQQLERLQDRR